MITTVTDADEGQDLHSAPGAQRPHAGDRAIVHFVNPRPRSPTLLTSRLYDRQGRVVLEDSNGLRWLVRESGDALLFISELRERGVTSLPVAWQHLSADELEQLCRTARRI